MDSYLYSLVHVFMLCVLSVDVRWCTHPRLLTCCCLRVFLEDTGTSLSFSGWAWWGLEGHVSIGLCSSLTGETRCLFCWSNQILWLNHAETTNKYLVQTECCTCCQYVPLKNTTTMASCPFFSKHCYLRWGRRWQRDVPSSVGLKPKENKTWGHKVYQI